MPFITFISIFTVHPDRMKGLKNRIFVDLPGRSFARDLRWDFMLRRAF
jgi:hypothetical protein